MPSKTVKVETPDAHGSGAFVAADLVVTAAHVIHPQDQDEPWEAGRLTITLPDHHGTELPVLARLCHPRWGGEFNATADIAILRVGEPQRGLVVPFASNAAARQRAVSITGYREGPNQGTVTRVAGAGGRDVFDSDDLAYHEGVSGALVVTIAGQAIGVATRSAAVPTHDAFIGIPFLDSGGESNLAWLIANCPAEDD